MLMRRYCDAAVLLTFIVGGCAAKDMFQPAPAEISIKMIDANTAEVTVRNPSPSISICTGKTSWLKGGVANAMLDVTGRDGKAWKFIGYYVEPGGDFRSDTLKLEPHGTISATVKIRDSYVPEDNADEEIASVKYNPRFVRC
jgi:hypothetical protein